MLKQICNFVTTKTPNIMVQSDDEAAPQKCLNPEEHYTVVLKLTTPSVRQVQGLLSTDAEVWIR